MKTAIAFLLMVPNLFALDITTLDGKTYLDCRVSRAFPDSICVLWSGGGARIKFTNLPESVRARYGYDEEKAASFERSEADRQARERTMLEAQRQFNQAQSGAYGQQNPSTPGLTPGAGGNTGAQYVGVNLAPTASAGYNQNAAYSQSYNQGFGFGGRNGRGGAQYVGVNMAGPSGAIYGIGYGPTVRSNPRDYFINAGVLR